MFPRRPVMVRWRPLLRAAAGGGAYAAGRAGALTNAGFTAAKARLLGSPGPG